MFLDQASFRTVVAATPLVSIDLLVQNAEGEVLLGQRLNRPAQGYWFVPGGRILKSETLDVAFTRLTQMELGTCFARNEADFMGVYEHFYTDSVFGASPDTHYVVLCYHLQLPTEVRLALPQTQHGHFRWWSLDEMRLNVAVHENTRAYLPALPQADDLSKGC
ncbi:MULTISPECIES: GDP-mannose mannosyl hydrolase [unclassified Microbulbifer]|uniref:GDP-mannose mannosyl hydrolase n=1 Tax=unclassified Microbulbifer TaxID=2619833 RepID=UPI0027E569A4|nr:MULTISPECIES: GDP-mannose mannosyl hydrolase [unclassified Microbulbifer]